jgi:hypothetical protein
MMTFATPRGRTPVVGHRPTPADTRRESDSGLAVVGGLLWLSGLVRVVLALQNHEVFGTEATLALMTVLLLPWLTLEWLRARGAGHAR